MQRVFISRTHTFRYFQGYKCTLFSLPALLHSHAKSPSDTRTISSKGAMFAAGCEEELFMKASPFAPGSHPPLRRCCGLRGPGAPGPGAPSSGGESHAGCEGDARLNGIKWLRRRDCFLLRLIFIPGQFHQQHSASARLSPPLKPPTRDPFLWALVELVGSLMSHECGGATCQQSNAVNTESNTPPGSCIQAPWPCLRGAKGFTTTSPGLDSMANHLGPLRAPKKNTFFMSTHKLCLALFTPTASLSHLVMWPISHRLPRLTIQLKFSRIHSLLPT